MTTVEHGKEVSLRGAAFLKEENRWLAEPHGSKALGESAERSNKQNRQIAYSIPYWEEWREEAYQVKRFAIHHLDQLLVKFEEKLAARGVTVLWAKDAEEANQHVINIVKEHDVKRVVKSKSMVSEEMEVNHVLAALGVQALETDLGEFLVQLAGQRPSHIVTPALHLSAADVGQLFAEKLGVPFTAEHEKLTDIARRHLRQEYLRADMGISGCNFGLADVGALCIVENEGNAGLSISSPPVHVALMGIEKVIPSIAYLPLYLNLLARSGTQQKLTTYTHLILGPTPGHKLYVIIIDNGRSRVLQDPATRSTLFCIRCGACLNSCPVYRRVGGWAYGWVYPGPIGSILTPHLVGFDKAGKLPFASSLCCACGEVCPVKVDIPHQLVYLRYRAVNVPSPVRSPMERLVWKAWAWAMAGPLRYRMAMGFARIGARLAKFLPIHPSLLGAWTRGRALPAVPCGTFRSWWRRVGRRYEKAGDQ